MQSLKMNKYSLLTATILAVAGFQPNAIACGSGERCPTLTKDGFCQRIDFDKRFRESKSKYFTLHIKAASSSDLKEVVELNMKEAEQAFKAVEKEMDRFCDIEESKTANLWASSPNAGQCGELSKAAQLAKDGSATVEGLRAYLEKIMRRAADPLQKAFSTAEKNLQMIKQKHPTQAATIDKLTQELDGRVYESGKDALAKTFFNDPFEKKRNELKSYQDRLDYQNKTVAARLTSMDCNNPSQKESEIANTSTRLQHPDARACGIFGCAQNADGTYSPKYAPRK